MHARDVVPGGVGRGHPVDDLVQMQRCRVGDLGGLRRVCQNFLWNQRARIQANRAARDGIAAAKGDQVWRAGAGADEVDGHSSVIPLGRVEVYREFSGRSLGGPTYSRGRIYL